MASTGADRLVAERQGLVRAFFARRCASPEDAEDLAQECFCAILESWPSFRGEAGSTTWIWAICRHVYARHLRSRELRERSARLLAAASEAVAGGAAQEEGRLSLELVRRRLDGGELLLFRCLYERGLGPAETAALLGRPLGTIKYQSFRLRKRLRELLGGASTGAKDRPGPGPSRPGPLRVKSRINPV